MSPDSTPPTRRSFLDYLLDGTAVATLGAIVYEIFRFMSPGGVAGVYFVPGVSGLS
jgi:hypothetical protein